MNVFEVITGRVIAALKRVIRESERPAEIDFSRVAVDPPREAAHGELSTNAAMVTAKPLAMNPKELAAKLAAVLKEDPDIVSAEVAGPGFINLTLTPSFWHGFLAKVLFLGPAYGRIDIGKGEAVNVEYVSTNPTGPIHVGHCRGAVVGDVLANLLEATGHQVTREYYINDAGAQVDVLARSSFLRYREALGEEIGTIPAGLYPGDYLKAVGSALAAEHGRDLLIFPEERWLPLVRVKAVDMMMALIKEDLAALNVTHETFFSERSLTEGAIDRVEQAIEFLRAKGDIYVGRLPPPKGQPSEDWEDREQTLFRSTAFGDDIDRPLKKSDGTNTYFAADIAYHYDKFLRGFSQMVDVLGADHGGYVKRMQAAVKAISGGAAVLDVKICQLVKLYRAGEPVKMSKRSGDFVTLREVVDEVGPDAVRFMMVFKKSDTPIDFDFVKVTEQSKENPVFYVQYAHARTASIFRQAATLEEGDLGAEFLKDLVNERVDAAYLGPLTDPGEMALLRRFADFPRTIESAARSHEPHRIAFYLYELAGEFHAQWNRGNENQLLRFVNPGHPHLTRARLALVHATRLILSCGLAILGVHAPDEMR